MEKVIRDGKVAVLYSPGYGAGWCSWESCDSDEADKLLFHPKFVAWVEGGKKEKIEDVVMEVFGENSHIYAGGAQDLVIAWLPEGTSFRVNEYDGYETLETRESVNWTVA